MELWNIIRDFFVQYVFGGVTSTSETYTGLIGSGVNSSDLTFQIGGVSLSLSDWLSTTATIIILCALVFALFLVTRYIFRVCAGLFKLN